MNIGYVKHKSNGVEGEGRKEWFELGIRPPFMQSATFSMHKNKNKTKATEPDYKIWTNYNRKGENFRGVEVGALWKKVQRDGVTPYFAGHIETPAVGTGKLYISLFETKLFQGEKAADIDWIYDVNWQPYSGGSNNQSTGGYTEPTAYTSSAHGGDIPIYDERETSTNTGSRNPITDADARLYM
jgi:uncharacterized protein (DUF736 family)